MTTTIGTPGGATTTDALPNLLLDAVEFGLEADLASEGGPATDEFVHRLCQVPGVKQHGRAITRAGTRAFDLSIPVKGADGTLLGTASAYLVLMPIGGRIVLGSGSGVRLNLQRLLRADLGRKGCGPAGLDGNDNVTGPLGTRGPKLLVRQLRLAGAAVDGLVDALNGALPADMGAKRQRLWLRSAEVCRDLASPDAVGEVRALQRTCLAGSEFRAADCYIRGALDERGVPAVRWRQSDDGPVFKAYAKRSDLTRLEVAYPQRGAIRRILGADEAELGGAEAVRLLRGFVMTVAGGVDELERHVAEARGAKTDGLVTDLVLHLAPLVALAAGSRVGPGRPPAAQTVSEARAALRELIEARVYRATGARAKGGLRAVLNGLSGDSGPLRRGGGRGTVFTVRPGLVG